MLSIENFTNQLQTLKYQEENFEQTEFSENTYESSDRIKVFDSIEEINVFDNTNIQLDENSTVPIAALITVVLVSFIVVGCTFTEAENVTEVNENVPEVSEPVEDTSKEELLSSLQAYKQLFDAR